ncbi:MAG: PKD domain-containing protein, partial [Odoribacter sp.]|nr:PKD domain-containing protein [Odoribacter sp.]
YYEDSENHQGFDMRYWYSDTVYKDMPESCWREVTGMKDTVSTSKDISFFVSGYYKMMITANNMCNDVAGIKYDTLWTHRISWDETDTLRRYFQVYAGDSTKLVCKDTILCMNKKQKIVFVDYNSRRGYERPPVYTVNLLDVDSLKRPELSETDQSPIRVESCRTEIWQGGKIIDDMDLQKTCGCDSTVIVVELDDYKFYGKLKIQVSKSGDCASGASVVFEIDAGRDPGHNDLHTDLLQDLGNYGVKEGARCDTFSYALPLEDLLLKEDYMWGFELDSVRFALKQGNADEKIVYYRQGGTKDLTFLFDSTEVESRIVYRSYNRCGMKEDTLSFRVYAKPNVELWRDSVAGNDSLCVDMAYPYYWEGKFPPQYEMLLLPCQSGSEDRVPVTINGVESSKGQVAFENGDTIRYTETGDITETIVIYNTNQPSCNATLALDLTVLNQPDVPRFKDSIGICEGLGTLDTRKLFAAGKSDFNRAEWQLNDGAADKEKFPVFTLSENREDTLHYTLLQSKGCYRKGDLPVRPQKAPELVLKPDYRYCLPDSIKELREEGFVEKISEWAGCNSLKVFKDVVGSEPLYNEGTWGVSKLKKPYIPENGRKLIYEMTNIRVDTAFMGKCRVTDTVALQVSAPKLQVLKDDTLKYPWTRYEFSRMRGHIDTAALDKASLKWTLQPDGKPAGTGLFEPVYDLTETEKSRDTLLFELSALNYCGDEWKDTLYVRLNHLKLEAYKDTICSNTENYRLWDKVKASFADPSTVTWKIVYPEESRGTLSATTGINATYTPEGLETGDSVRIALEAALVDAAEVKDYDTVVLKINKAPIFKFVKDTLWVCNNEIKIARLQEDQKGVIVVKENIGKRADGVDWISRGDFVNEGKGQFGQWANGGDYNFPSDHMLGQEENVTQKVSYRAHGLKGCADVLDSVVLLNPVRATLTFKRPAEEMCAGESIWLDTLYTMKGADSFTHITWEQGDLSSGRIEDGRYVANFPQDSVQRLYATTYKEYTCYTGASSGKVLETPNPYLLRLTVHREPEFKVVDTYKYDTLCYADSEIVLPQAAVETKKSYPDYRDSVLVNGERLMKDGLKFEHTQPGTLEKYVVTVLQGRCTNWKDKSDTIYVYHLPKMITGSIPEMSVCEGSSVEVNESQLTFNRLASKPDWSKTTGGVLSQGDDGKMIFTPAIGLDDEGATVTVTVNPPHGCPEESMTGVVKVGRKPRLSNHAYVFCQVAGHTATVSGELASNAGVVLDAIKWYRIAVDDEEITTGVKSNWDLELQVTEADLSKSPLLLRAEMRCSGACSGVFNDTVSITWQEAPVITVESGLAVCQASPDGLALGQKVSVTHGNGTTWSLVTTDKGTWDNDALTFKPGDVSGTASVQVTVAGLATCPSETKTVNIEVLAAPASGISIAGERCSTRELAMKPANEQADNGYEWSFGDGNTASEKSVKKSYAQTGTYTVTMTGKFQNGCTRVEKEEVTVNLRPTAAFTMQDPAPVKTLIEITSTSTPENVTCNWRIDGSTTYSDKNPASHRFDLEGTHTVMLEVVTPEGCKDTLTKKPTVLSEPVAKFEIKVDSCTGEVQITNRSELHGAAIAWDFGNGSSVSDAETPGKQLYQPIYRDTTYTITLTLTNVSGSSKASR